MQVSGSEHATPAHATALRLEGSDTINQRPLAATQQAGGLSLLELGKRIGRLLAPRQRLEAEPLQAQSTGTSPESSHRPLLRPAPASPEMELARLPGRRFQGLNIERLLSHDPSRHATTSLEMSLGPHGRLVIGDNTPTGLRHLLQATLGQASKTYLAHHGEPDGDQLLMDRQGTLLHLRQTPAAIVVLRSSRPSDAKRDLDALCPGGVAEYHLQREEDGDSIQVRARPKNGGEEHSLNDLDIGGRSHLAQLTGIHEDTAAQRLRLHDGKLYRFDIEEQAWALHPANDGTPFKQLSLQADGHLYALHGDHLVNLSASQPTMPLAARGAVAFSVAADGTAALLCGKGAAQSVRLVRPDQADSIQAGLAAVDGQVRLQLGLVDSHHEHALRLDGGNAEATRIGIADGRLFLIDNEGRLYSAAPPSANGPLDLQPDAEAIPNGQALGRTTFAEGFMQDDQAHLNVLVKDAQGQLHSQPVNLIDQPAKGGWNLTDALVLDNRRGLPEPQPAQANTLNLGRLGHVALEGGELLRWDATANTWASTGVKGVERLQQGLDGKPYILKSGKLQKLDVTLSVGRFLHDGQHSLAPIGQNIKVAGGRALPAASGLRDVALVNEKLFVTLGRDGRLELHHPTRPDGEIPRTGLDEEIQSLALDEKQTLYALTQSGRLFSLPRADWQAAEAEQREPAAWQPCELPDEQPLQTIRTGPGNRLLASLRGAEGAEELRHDASLGWHPHQPSDLSPPQALKSLFERVRDDSRTWKLGGATVKASVNRAGRNSAEYKYRSGTGEFIRAHVFKPTLETPRPLKNLGYNLQHRWQGREGLSPIYEAESTLFEQLKSLADKTTPAAGQDLKARIAGLDLGTAGAPLKAALETFQTELQRSCDKHAVALGQAVGVLNMHGEPREDFKPPRLGALRQKLDPYSAGAGLAPLLRDALARVAPADARAVELLDRFTGQGALLSYRKSEMPLGRRRDPGDDSALLKARLALDIATLHELNALVDRLEDAPLEESSKALSALRDQHYHEHPLKVVTDMGFRSHDSLEANYDAVKAFLKAFRKTDHAVHINLRGAFGGDSADMAKGLKAALKEIEGYHELHVQRGYGGRLSTPTTGPGGVVTYPSGSLGANRGYSLTFQMEDHKFTKEERFLVTFVRQGGGSGSVGFGIRDRTLGRSHGVGPEREASLSFPLDASLRASVSGSTQDALTFMLAPGEIDAFVDSLVEGTLDPYELMRRGVEHEVQHGYRFSVDLDVSASANVGYGVNMAESQSPLDALFRMQGGAELSLNLINYSQHRLASSGAFQREEGSLNRPRFFNQFRAALHLPQAHLIGSHTAPDGEFQQARGGLDNSVSATMETRTTKRYKFLFKAVEPITEADVAKAAATLGKAFRDKASAAALKEMATERDLGRRLERMGERFAGREPENDDQYAALRSLRALADKHVATLAGHSLLGEAYFDSTYTDLGRLDKMSLLTRLSAGLNPNHVQSNAEYIAGLMANDPKLESLIKHLQDTPGTTARVRLELKDAVKAEIERGSRDGTLTEDQLIAKLQDRANLRLKAIFLFQTVDKREGFTSPLPLVSYNSETSLNLVRCLGRVIFDFGRDQNTPKGYTLDGDIAHYDEPTQEGIAAMKREGFDLRRP
ncbi:AvrE-family type 3 secretion system effector [Pseudomonas indica]|uniref:AvrE-family type 3 secretion system effector n=1 Tax=Pseudomonas indica TaxID=137658 RepID=UPI0023F8E557|nr:AvrE-family type 3 secretion system effector [Pseudomonas indica]MBU3059571.1 AvrE-family type 3 secretion system effector [Pseudomonas indica]